MPSRVVPPHTTKLPISNGDWLLVRKRLNHGEQQAAFRRMYVTGSDGVLRRDHFQDGMALVTAYLVDWSLTDDADQPLAIRGESLDAIESIVNTLDHESYAEIKTAIEQHELRMLAARAEEKKIQIGETTSPTTSASPSEPAGASSG